MSKIRRQVKSTPEQRETSHLSKRIKEGIFILLIALGLFIFLAFITYNPGDPSWANTGTGGKVSNMGGEIGAWIAGVFL